MVKKRFCFHQFRECFQRLTNIWLLWACCAISNLTTKRLSFSSNSFHYDDRSLPGWNRIIKSHWSESTWTLDFHRFTHVVEEDFTNWEIQTWSVFRNETIYKRKFLHVIGLAWFWEHCVVGVNSTRLTLKWKKNSRRVWWRNWRIFNVNLNKSRQVLKADDAVNYSFSARRIFATFYKHF